MKNFRFTLFMLFCGLTMFVLAGCKIPGKVTGGGQLPSANSGSAKNRAVFAFNAAQCVEEGPLSGKFNYADKAEAIKFNADIIAVSECISDPDLEDDCEFCDDFFLEQQFSTAQNFRPATESNGRSGTYEIEFDYRSTNPRNSGNGLGIACVLDTDGEFDGGPLLDSIALQISSGPFDGYQNQGEISRGNIQAHDCTCTDGVDNDDDGCVDADDPGCQGSDGLNGDEDDALGVCSL